jgi:hypothetical protein
MANQTGVSDFGLFMLTFAALLLLIGLIKVLSWLTLVQERGGFGILIRDAIGRYAVARPAPRYVSPDDDDTDDGHDMQTGIHTGMRSRPYQPYQPGDMSPAFDRAGADIDAANAGMDSYEPPRIGRYLGDDEILVMLAVQRLPDGRYRYSANRLVQFVDGDRNTVLATIRAIRDAPQYPAPLTDDQRTARAVLDLEH